MGFSVAASVLLMGLKFYTFWLTGSNAVLSDALESIINVVASSFALWSVIFASRPPDVDHPYGHGKAEFVSAGFEGALIVLASGAILWEALPGMFRPTPLPNLDAGLLILLATAAANGILGAWLVRMGRRTRSAAILADGKHIITDVYTSAGVLAGLVLVRQTGWLWLDGAIACLVAVNILFIGIRLVRESSSRLMDAYDPKLLEQITGVIEKHRRPVWVDMHHLRAWRSGDRIHVDFHLILPRDLTLEEAHREVSDIEQLLKTHVEGLGDAMVHAEPCISPQCPYCGHDPCLIRRAGPVEQNIWGRESSTAACPDHEVREEHEHSGAGPDRKPS